MNLIGKLNKAIPKDVVELTLEVNSVPGFLDDAGIYESWVGSGVLFKARNCDSREIRGHIRCGIWRTYSNYLREGAIAAAYFSERGVKVVLEDSKASGRYKRPSDRVFSLR